MLGVTVTFITFTLGKISNGGYFNPALSFAVLLLQYEKSYFEDRDLPTVNVNSSVSIQSSKNKPLPPEPSFRAGIQGLLENLKFFFLLIFSQLVGMLVGIVLVKFYLEGMASKILGRKDP